MLHRTISGFCLLLVWLLPAVVVPRQASAEPNKQIKLMVDGKRRELNTDLYARVKHICSGHTHVKFSNFEWNGKIHHNTGGVLKCFDREPEELGFIAGRMSQDGSHG